MIAPKKVDSGKPAVIKEAALPYPLDEAAVDRHVALRNECGLMPDANN